MRHETDSRSALRWLSVLATVATVACGRGGADVTAPAEALLASDGDQGQGRVLIVEDIDAPQWRRDAVTITSATIDNDTLTLGVSFGGGCAEHRFQLLTGAAWMESYPVQVAMRLAHDDADDPCDAVVEGTVRFDLSPLARAYRDAYQTATGTIALRLAGAPSLRYEF